MALFHYFWHQLPIQFARNARFLSGEGVENGFVIATHTPESRNDYLGNMFVVTVFEDNTTVEVYNTNASKMLAVFMPLE